MQLAEKCNRLFYCCEECSNFYVTACSDAVYESNVSKMDFDA